MAMIADNCPGRGGVARDGSVRRAPGGLVGPDLALVPGWSFDGAVFAAMRDALPCPARVFAPGEDAAAVPAGAIGVGHSLGGLWLLRHAAGRLRGLVLINGFARLTAAVDWPDGVAPRVLARMRARCATEPEAVVAAFRARIGAPEGLPVAEAGRLAAGLAELATWDMRAELARLRVPVLCLAAPDDGLVSVALSRATAALAGGAPDWQAGGHCLPLSAPHWCAARIAAFAARA